MIDRTTQDRNTRASLFTYLQTEGEGQMWACAVCSFVCVCQMVNGNLLHPYKHNQCHQEQAAGAIDSHVVGRCFFDHFFWWNDVELVDCKEKNQIDRGINVQSEGHWHGCLLVGHRVYKPKESLWFQECTRIQRRWFPGTNKVPQHLQTLDPRIWRSCNMSHQLSRSD